MVKSVSVMHDTLFYILCSTVCFEFAGVHAEVGGVPD